MSTQLAPARVLAPRRPDWVGRVLAVLGLTGLGLLLGHQYLYPNKRVISVLAAVVVFGIAWRMNMIAGLGLLVTALPFPRGTVFGNTNLALILLLLVIWLLRFTQGQSPSARRTAIDLPVAGLFIAYVVSFNNITRAANLAPALANFQLFVACLLMFYMIVSNLRRPEDLERVHVFQLISALTVYLLAVYEVNNPGAPFIRGWIQVGAAPRSEINLHLMRVGSSFGDFELLSEYCALNLLLVVFRLVRASSVARKVLYGALGLLNSFVLFATVTRGAIVSLAVGLLYLAFLLRKRIRFVPLVLIAALVIGLFFGMNFFVSTYTRSGSLLARLSETRLVGGWMPESRAGTWQTAWDRILVHPIIGQGPYYAEMPGYAWTWPHNGYLYIANLVGLVGLGFFLWIVGGLWRTTRPMVDDLAHGNYAQAFLVIARVQLLVFLVDQVKIDYLRNSVYAFQVWLWFACFAAASHIARTPQAQRVAPA
jgi:O-antigen ligase